MTEQQQRWIAELSRCSFYPGSWDKRFVRDMATLPADKELTERQAAALLRTAWRYRKQRGDPNMARPNDPYLLGPHADDVAREQDMLDAWNRGDPL